MLVLTRKKGESIMIGDQIELIVLGTEGDTVKLGIKAPRHVDIFRKEVYDTIRDSNRQALRKVALQELNMLTKSEEN
ncbi:carbon storage regulator CsrA [Paenibacillus sp. GYB003]|uniref:carbon storage regulator CsrA n=1 Tax=Paenibacillus sp. GYB003 TaxID=2994392 RepID=UPI002F96D931